MTKPHIIYITGGAQGIGLGIAHTLLTDGYRVAITDIDKEALSAAAERLPHRENLLTLMADVSDEAQVAASLEKTVGHFGQLNGIVHNAGLADPFHGPVEHRDIDREQHPAGRVGTPEDIAALTRFLLSKESGFITGQNFVADGGMTRKMIYAE